ncbi:MULTISPECIES: EAL domain-containing protein [unclassified Pseudoalteromonas]|uniref:bifunctional diguanylate cyclase/phosphodiesterase n=1 Tax=Pseudoalteromonas TaxID=53246 RepID=UPI0010229BFF|nr:MULTISPECIES: EAL domain-containing protein [unclassified Pseudoalteromonas]MCP4586806.1 EAL domain-containing protein [Pseudoalteromonas sp.]NIZ06682.1 EAL domain-containing protein [Pseudoalteromonas sp. HF66]RZD21796.1 EAL domain-containing protein [Pseudoalteromonas sp. MEBiC 03485]
MIHSLRGRIIALCVSLVLLTSLVSLASSWWSTNRFNDQKLREDINVAENVFKQYLSAKESLLLTAAKVLTADFGFKQAIATQDADTISSVLNNHSRRINADLMLLIDLSGQLVSANTEFNHTPDEFSALMNELLINAEQSNFIVLDQTLYQVILLPVRAPRTVAYSLVGFEINDLVAAELKNLTTMDVSFIGEDDGVVETSLTKQPQTNSVLAHFNNETTQRIFGEKPVYRNRLVELPSLPGHIVSVLLSADLTQSYREFEQLFFTIIVLAAITVVIGVLTSGILAKNLTTPLSKLTLLAQQFARGNYKAEFVGKKQSSEITTLVDAFNNMGNDIKEREQQISFQASHDSLTGFYTRSAMLENMENLFAEGAEYTLVAIDIRGLRHINDKLGPRIGDDCLKAVAERIGEYSAHHNGENARIGGDEFLTLLPADETKQFKDAVMKLVAQLQAGYLIQGLNITLRFSVGVVHCLSQNVSPEDLMRRSLIAVDTASCEHKTIHYYQEGEDEEHLERLAIIDELKQALVDDDGQLFMTYQPKLNIKTNCIDKVESLIRWQRKDGQWVSPELFIDLAEQSGVIVELTSWVVKTVVSQVAAWQQQGVTMQAAINVSAQDIAYPSFYSHLAKQLEKHDVNGRLITIELTERDMIENEDQGIKALENLKTLGVKISLDDYGVGQTSLGRLKSLPIDELKLDKCFILQLDQSRQDQYIVQSTVTLGHQLGFSVVAEGVENKESLDILVQNKCDYAQGYYLSRPLKSEQFLQWLEVYNEAS